MPFYNRDNRRNTKFLSIVQSKLTNDTVAKEFPKKLLFNDYRIKYLTARQAEKAVERLDINGN